MEGGDMSKMDYKTYLELFNNMTSFMKDPHLIVYLKVSPEESLKRLKKRNRDIEKNVPLTYLKNLCDRYDDFVRDVSKKIPVLEIQYNKFKNPKEMAKKINEEWNNLMNVKKINVLTAKIS